MSWECSRHGTFEAEGGDLHQGLIDSQNRVHCPDCGVIMTNNKDEPLEDLPEPKDEVKADTGGEAPRTSAKRQVELSAEDLHLTKKMVKEGLAEDLEDAHRKALRFYGGVRFNETMLGGETQMNEQLIDKLSEGDGESMVEKAMAFSMLNGSMGAANQSQGGNSMDMTEMMMIMKVMNDDKPARTPQQQSQGNNLAEMMMLMKMMNSGGTDTEDLVSILNSVQNQGGAGGNGMDPAMMMMMQQDNGKDDAYKELLQRFESQREQQTELEQKMLEEKFGNELGELKKQMRSIAQEVDEAKNEDDLDTALDRLERLKTQAEKIGMVGNEDGESDEARTAERLIDSFGENFAPVVEKYMESQGGAGGLVGGGSPQQQPQRNSPQPQVNQQEIQEAQQQAQEQVSQPSPEDVEPSF